MDPFLMVLVNFLYVDLILNLKLLLTVPHLYMICRALLECQSLKLFLLLPVSRDFTRMWIFFSKYFVSSAYVKLEITTQNYSQYKNEYSTTALGIRPCYTSRARNFKHGSTHGCNINTPNSLILTVTIQVFWPSICVYTGRPVNVDWRCGHTCMIERRMKPSVSIS
jgi:hypothetical protein